MSITAFLLIIVAVFALIIIMLSWILKSVHSKKKKLENELNNIKSNVVKLRTGYSNDEKAISYQKEIDKKIKGATNAKTAKEMRDSIVDSITNGLQDYYANNL